MKTQMFRLVLVSGLALGCSQQWLLSQQYSVDWYKVAAGGGTSTNAQFVLSGTAGQPDAAAALTGGSYMLSGGFWSIVAVQTAGAPALSIFRTTTNQVVVSWPAPSTGYALQQNPGFAPGDWVNVPSSPVVVGEQNEVLISPQLGRQYYFRLKK